ERYRSGVQESMDVVDHALGFIQQEQVATTLDDAQLRGGHQAGHDPRVGKRDDRVIVARDDERGLGYAPQPGDARPARRGVQLVAVAEELRWAREPRGGLAFELAGIPA